MRTLRVAVLVVSNSGIKTASGKGELLYLDLIPSFRQLSEYVVTSIPTILISLCGWSHKRYRLIT